MGNVIRRMSGLFDDATGALVGYLDGAGQEQSLLTAAQMAAVAAGATVDRPNTLGIIGDSISGYNFQRITATAVARSSNVLTVTAVSHGVPSGAPVAVYGVTNDETMNVSMATWTRVDANSGTVASAGADGTGTLSTARLVNLQNWSAQGYLAWGLILAQARGRLVYAGIRGGATIEQLSASGFVSACVAANPGFCVVMAGTNNATGATNTGTIITNKLWTYLYQPLLAAGIKVFACSIPPVDSGEANFARTTSHILEANEGIRRLCRTTPGLIWVDLFSAIVNPTGSGASASGTINTSDHLHPYDKGAAAMGVAMATALTANMPALNDLVSSDADNYGTSSTNKNILDIGLMSGTNGTVAGTVTNNGGGNNGVGTTWKCDNTNSTSDATKGTRADGIGADQILTTTPAGSDSSGIIETVTGGSNPLTSRILGGRWYEMLMEVTATGWSAANVTSISAYLSITVDGVSYNVGHMQGYTGDSNVPSADLTAAVFRSLPFWIPAGTITSPQLILVSRHSGAGSALTMKLGRVSFKDLS